MFCENCGIEAPTKYVTFYQNIGLLVMRLTRTMQGELCKSCIHKTFWSFTTITILVGWLGMISLVLAPCFVLNNFIRYLLCLGMPGVPFGAIEPVLDDVAIQKLEPHINYLVDRMNAGDQFELVAGDTALRAGVTPGQVVLFVRALLAAQNEQG